MIRIWVSLSLLVSSGHSWSADIYRMLWRCCMCLPVRLANNILLWAPFLLGTLPLRGFHRFPRVSRGAHNLFLLNWRISDMGVNILICIARRQQWQSGLLWSIFSWPLYYLQGTILLSSNKRWEPSTHLALLSLELAHLLCSAIPLSLHIVQRSHCNSLMRPILLESQLLHFWLEGFVQNLDC